MAKKFHIAVFCSDSAYIERQAFYSSMFGAPSHDGCINEGAESHRYNGSMWDRQDGVIFALLVNPALTGSVEQLAHVGFIFDNGAEFDAEIQFRGIDARRIKVLPAGQRQVFVQDPSVPGVEWEFSLETTTSS